MSGSGDSRRVMVLPEHVANKIAAGEVVERPASVVKELLENSVDAGSTRIDITVENGGRRRIEIRDNGCGMCREDAVLCLERQATSKIREVEDIERIGTLGFRGEAVPSIASVSRMSIVTRRAEDDAGTEVVIAGGSVESVSDIGTAPGTIVNVRDLFFNVPVRRKFLRSPQTELTHIKTVFTVHALAHPALALSLVSDGRMLYRFPGGGSLKERVADIFGGEFTGELREISYASDPVRISGFVGVPSSERSSRGEQYVFVNNRPATAPVVQFALREAFPGGDGANRPPVILFISVPCEEVDVNVHPAKREVRFVNGSRIRDAIISAVRNALAPQPIRFASPEPPFPPPAPVPENREPPPSLSPAFGEDDAICFPQRPQAGSAPPPAPPPLPEMPIGDGLALFDEPEPSGAPWKWSKVIGPVADKYLLVETDSGFATVEIRAARERVLCEKMMKSVKTGTPDSQKLLIPETVRLSPPAASRLRRYLDAMQGAGFQIEDFGDDHFKVDAVPAALAGNGISCREMLLGIVDDIERVGVRRGADRWREEAVVRSVCGTVPRKAVLRAEDAQRLIDELAATDMPYLSPRGKPTMVFTSFNELERKLGN